MKDAREMKIVLRPNRYHGKATGFRRILRPKKFNRCRMCNEKIGVPGFVYCRSCMDKRTP